MFGVLYHKESLMYFIDHDFRHQTQVRTDYTKWPVAQFTGWCPIIAEFDSLELAKEYIEFKNEQTRNN